MAFPYANRSGYGILLSTMPGGTRMVKSDMLHLFHTGYQTLLAEALEGML